MNDRQNQMSGLTPRLRFPEFRENGEWVTHPLRDSATVITERVGDRCFTPMSITSGVGLVTQEEKFGRTIAGEQYKNYIVIERDDFAYNKSSTKDYPQGFIARYLGNEPAAVPNSIFTCFRVQKDKLNPDYLNYLFANNLHGKWLNKYITVGARAHGSLNINDEDLLSLPIPRPDGRLSIDEQRRIADCLSSIDALITAESRSLDLLADHKKRLTKEMFPGEGETIPGLRFPEFRTAGEWLCRPLGQVFETTSGGTPDRTRPEFWNGNIPWITTSLVDFNVIIQSDEFISAKGLKNSSAKVFPKGTILVAMYGQGKTRGKAAMLGIDAATNQACAAILPKKGIDPAFVFLNLGNRYEELRELSNSGGQENLSQGLVRQLSFSFPRDIAEQKKVSACLISLNKSINAHTQKLEMLKLHKKGLMQQLFPTTDEVEG